MTLRKLRALAWRIRFLLLALVAVTVLGAVLQTLAGLRPASAEVLVAARELDSGVELAASDVRVAHVPLPLVPEGALTTKDDAVGRVLTSALPAGMPVPKGLLLSEDFLASAPRGHAVLPVGVASSAAAELASPGSTVALYAPPSEYSGSSDAVLVADGARVLGMSRASGGGGLLGGPADETLTLYVAVPQAQAPAVLGAAAQAPLLVVGGR